MGGWIGVDLDGTLAQYDGWVSETHIGAPIPKMVARVKQWRAEGRDVRIFTARVFGALENGLDRVSLTIANWSREHLGENLPMTCTKDYGMVELWDDRAIQVIPNTGERADGKES